MNITTPTRAPGPVQLLLQVGRVLELARLRLLRGAQPLRKAVPLRPAPHSAQHRLIALELQVYILVPPQRSQQHLRCCPPCGTARCRAWGRVQRCPRHQQTWPG